MPLTSWSAYIWSAFIIAHTFVVVLPTLAQSEMSDGSGGLNPLFGTASGYAPFASGFRDACKPILAPLVNADSSTYYLVLGLPVSLGSFNPFKAMGSAQICLALRPCTDGKQPLSINGHSLSINLNNS